ncbi:flagellar hook-length control protein FliK [Jannaschia sp. S6380]|uniref:flagellar hook-length control protein FliK n=1 Tax=Jannaschia sp. S6380 TaxID=2926408 RepID=UPI001FF39F1D|nr:flagellar hook-length control protein FliK [Jannaschia sp. S6380]MCK0168881.1 flagellar hook-length control protein FliK [Jannaschia sp. S6380]
MFAIGEAMAGGPRADTAPTEDAEPGEAEPEGTDADPDQPEMDDSAILDRLVPDGGHRDAADAVPPVPALPFGIHAAKDGIDGLLAGRSGAAGADRPGTIDRNIGPDARQTLPSGSGTAAIHAADPAHVSASRVGPAVGHAGTVAKPVMARAEDPRTSPSAADGPDPSNATQAGSARAATDFALPQDAAVLAKSARPTLSPDLTALLTELAANRPADPDAIPRDWSVGAVSGATRMDSQDGARPVLLAELRQDVPQRIGQLLRGVNGDGVELRAGDGDLSTELELAPAELGRLRLTLNTTERGLHLAVLIERPESVEAVRRHLEGLHRSLLADGVTLGSIDIGTGQRRGGEDRPARAEHHQADAADIVEPEHPDIAARRPTPVPGGRLDLRF